jgi:hypothetical protein
MATLKEKENLIEAFKGPFFYRVRLWGYGAETSYMKISKEAHDFWKAHGEEHSDSDVVNYIINAEDVEADDIAQQEDYDALDPATIPREALFMHDEDGVGSTYYEPIDQFEATYSIAQDAAYLTVEKVSSEEYDAEVLEDTVEHEDLNEFLSRVGEESDWEHDGYVEGHEFGNKYPEKDTYICQFQSQEKGTFFEAMIETALPFNQNLLKFATEEAPDGEDLVYGVEYDGVEIDNEGGDTNGKGYYAHFWKQEY